MTNQESNIALVRIKCLELAIKEIEKDISASPDKIFRLADEYFQYATEKLPSQK